VWVRSACLALASLLLLAGCATGAIGGSGGVAGEVSTCATQTLAPGWLERSSGDPQALLEPFLSCASPGDFLALQRRVDMPRLVVRLDAWSAVRLGALGPVCEEASGPLNRQRTAFLLQALESYGAANTEVLAHFVLDSCHDDDLKDILRLLAQDKRLTELLEQLPSLGPALEARGIKPSAYTERDFQWSDVGRGLSRAAKDALSTSPVVNGAQSTLMALHALKARLPPPYQRALDAVEHEQLAWRFSAGPLAVGVVDHMTFGVPLGFYGLVAGTGQGAHSLVRGRCELSRARPEATGSSTGGGNTKGASAANEAARPLLKQGGVERPTTLAAWVDERAGLTREVVQAKLAAAELEASSPRLPKDVAVLEKQRPSLDASPPEAQGNPRWSEYVAYYERRLAEIKEGKAAKGPLRWEAYERLWGWFSRGLAFERVMVERLKADAALPRAQRRLLGDFDKPRIETYVGVRKPDTGLRFVDVLIIEEGELAGRSPRVETMSFKSRDLSGLKDKGLEAQMVEDANEALWKYGKTLNIRRDSLQPFFRWGSEVSVQRVRLVYEGGALIPKDIEKLKSVLDEVEAKVPGVVVLFQ
jgi:hypothetical protein